MNSQSIYVPFGLFFWDLQDQKVHRYFGSSQLGTSWNQPLCSTPEMRDIVEYEGTGRIQLEEG